MKVFISQPMSGREHEEIEAERAKIMDWAVNRYGADEKVSEIASYFGPLAKFTPLESLGLDIQMMSRADVVVFAPGWKDARGCRIERICADGYGLDVIELYLDKVTNKYMILFNAK